MSPPENTKAAPARGRLSNLMTTRATNNAKDTVPDVYANRSTPEQVALLDLFAEHPLDQAARIVPRSRTAYADLWAPDAPDGRRTQWSMKYFCPLCRHHHDGRAESVEAARGKRRAGCGRIVRIRVRHVYDARPVEAVSA